MLDNKAKILRKNIKEWLKASIQNQKKACWNTFVPYYLQQKGAYFKKGTAPATAFVSLFVCVWVFTVSLHWKSGQYFILNNHWPAMKLLRQNYSQSPSEIQHCWTLCVCVCVVSSSCILSYAFLALRILKLWIFRVSGDAEERLKPFSVQQWVISAALLSLLRSITGQTQRCWIKRCTSAFLSDSDQTWTHTPDSDAP